MQPILIPKPAQSVFPISVQFPSRDRLLKVALFGCLFFLQLVSHLGFALPHRYIFVCWRSIACTFTGDCLFICLFFRTVAGTLGKVALSQMFVLHSHDEAWKEKNKVDEQDNCAQEKNGSGKKILHRIKVVLIQRGIFSVSAFPRNPSSHTEEG